MTITTRTGKGAALTYAELDANFTDLDTRTGSGWNDLVADVQARTGANAPSFGQYRDGIYLFSFDPNTMNECWANFHVRHDYIADTMIYPHVHWSTNTTSTGTIRWGVEYTWARRDDYTGGGANTGQVDFPATNTLYIEHTLSTNEQYQHQVNEAADGNGIPGTGIQEDAVIMCRFFRDAAHPNDTFPDAVYLITVDLHYQCNSLATPSRFPPFV